jgi:hypothetical protein
MSTTEDGHRKAKHTMGAVLGDSQKIDRPAHSRLAYTFAMSWGIEIVVALTIVQHVGPGHAMEVHSVLQQSSQWNY